MIARFNLFRIRLISTKLAKSYIQNYSAISVNNKLSDCFKKSRSMDLQEVVSALNRYAPLHLSESWDNTGLLLEPSGVTFVSKILLTNDLTLDVMKEAEELQINLIISYHPPLFQPLKRITKASWKERIIGRCLANGIAVYSPHTCYDALDGGVNDWLISAFGKGSCSPISNSAEPIVYSHHIKINLYESGMSSDSISQVISSGLHDQDLLKDIKITKGSGTAIDIFCKQKQLSTIISQFSVIETEIDHYEIYKLEKTVIANTGMGRILKLDSPLTVFRAIVALKKHLHLKNIRLALKHEGSLEDNISTIAVCAGSGGSVLKSVVADLFVTGEMSHHEVLHLTQSGITTLLTDHSNSERGFLADILQPHLEDIFKDRGIIILVSETDCDPLKII